MSKYAPQIMRAARDNFAQFGYFGCRVETISDVSHVNKRLVYEYCHTKDGLYLMVLSEVSREVMEDFEKRFKEIDGDFRSVYGELFNMLDNYSDFLRLWAWERMATTIHGPRILETVTKIFETIRDGLIQLNKKKGGAPLSDEHFEAIEALCHGYLLTAAMYLRCDPETDGAEEGETNARPALKRLDMTMNLQSVVLDSIDKLITGK